MAVCFELINGSLVSSSTPAAQCTGYVLLDSVDYSNWMKGLTNWSLDAQLIELGFIGAVSSWCAGLAVGFVMSHLRKLRP